MAIVTPPAANADSYISLADANTYFSSRLSSGAWTGATDANKEAALKRATALLDAEDWVGEKSDDLASNSLRWPRSLVYNKDGQSLPSDAVPQAIEYATAELAIELLEEAAATGAAQVTTDLKVGSIELSFENAETSGVYQKQYSSFVESLIAPYRNSNANSATLVRA